MWFPVIRELSLIGWSASVQIRKVTGRSNRATLCTVKRMFLGGRTVEISARTGKPAISLTPIFFNTFRPTDSRNKEFNERNVEDRDVTGSEEFRSEGSLDICVPRQRTYGQKKETYI